MEVGEDAAEFAVRRVREVAAGGREQMRAVFHQFCERVRRHTETDRRHLRHTVHGACNNQPPTTNHISSAALLCCLRIPLQLCSSNASGQHMPLPRMRLPQVFITLAQFGNALGRT